jgi:hypothetical protein
VFSYDVLKAHVSDHASLLLRCLLSTRVETPSARHLLDAGPT